MNGTRAVRKDEALLSTKEFYPSSSSRCPQGLSRTLRETLFRRPRAGPTAFQQPFPSAPPAAGGLHANGAVSDDDDEPQRRAPSSLCVVRAMLSLAARPAVLRHTQAKVRLAAVRLRVAVRPAGGGQSGCGGVSEDDPALSGGASAAPASGRRPKLGHCTPARIPVTNWLVAGNVKRSVEPLSTASTNAVTGKVNAAGFAAVYGGGAVSSAAH